MFLLWGKHVRKYYLRYAVFFVIGFVALIAVDYFQLMIPEIIGDLIDELNEVGTIDVTSKWFLDLILKVGLVAVVIFFGRIIWRISLFFASNRIETHLRYEMFLKAERLDLTYYHSNKIGNIMNWCTTDVETVEQFLGWGTLMLIDGVFLTVLTLSRMFIADAVLASIIIIPIILIAIWGAICEGAMSKVWDLRQESNDKIYDFSQESFTGIRVIKAFVKENQQIFTFAKYADENRNMNIKFTLFSVTFDVIIELIIALVISIILGFGGWFVYGTITGDPVVIFGNQIHFTSGRLVTFYGYFDYLIWPMIALGQVVTMFSQASASYKRIARFLDAEEKIVDKEGAVDLEIKGKVTFDHFSFAYEDGEFDCLKDITLTINPGEIVGVIGTVGSGKTTLVSVLMRLYNVKENSLFIDDVDIMNIKVKSLREGISIAPQDNFLFSDTIQNNIAFSNKDIDFSYVEEGAKFSDVHNDIMEFEDGYASLLGENGQTVSGGQKQRISLARAYLKNAPIMILDDSVSAVDLKTEENILANIREKRAGKTTIIIASRVSTVMDLDKIIVLSKGTLEAFDTPTNLLKTSETFAKMVALQELEKEKGGING